MPLRFSGIANASAAIALDDQAFLVADDEAAALFVFAIDRPEKPPRRLKLADLVGEALKGESDLEASARLGELTLWISSHSADDRGRPAPGRQMLFATHRTADGGLARHGAVFTGLLSALEDDAALARVLGLPKARRIGPKAKGGISIEGLAVTAKGHLLVGFRNPLHAGHAILAKIKNPLEVLAGYKPVFARPVLIDLGGRGIRSIERIGERFLLVGGPVANEKDSRLYQWSGKRRDRPQRLSLPALDGLNPEAMFVTADGRQLAILSDDGRRYKGGDRIGGPPSFRMVLLDLADLGFAQSAALGPS